MARFHSMLGWATIEEVPPNSKEYKEVIVEKQYSGEILRNVKRWKNGEHLNDDLEVDIRISIVADDFAKANLPALRYAIYSGARWKISNIDIQPPRLILSLGGVYNGPTPIIPPTT